MIVFHASIVEMPVLEDRPLWVSATQEWKRPRDWLYRAEIDEFASQIFMRETFGAEYDRLVNDLVCNMSLEDIRSDPTLQKISSSVIAFAHDDYMPEDHSHLTEVIFVINPRVALRNWEMVIPGPGC